MKVIIDTDPGVDDMQALIMAYMKPDVEIVAVTTVAGNGDYDRVYKNAVKINNFLNMHHIPVFKSSKVNMTGETGDQDSYFGKDAMAEIDLEDVSPKELPKMSSSKALRYYTKKYPGEIVLIAMGPLTNLATAYLYDHDFPSRLKDLYVMGGDIAEVTTINCCDYAEFNAWNDPASWNIVMKNFVLPENKKIKLIEFDFCRKHMIPIDFISKYYNQPPKCNTKYELPCKLAQKVYGFMKGKFSPSGTITADPFLIYIAICEDKKVKGKLFDLVSVDLSRERGGHTVFKENPNGNIFIYEDLDMENFLKEFLMSIHGC